MSQTIAVEIPDEIAEHYPDQQALQQGVFEGLLIREFQKGNLSIRESAALLALSYEEFLAWLNERNVPFASATEVELEQSYRDFERFLKARHPL